MLPPVPVEGSVQNNRVTDTIPHGSGKGVTAWAEIFRSMPFLNRDENVIQKAYHWDNFHSF
jgi:hypothetical protein